MNKVELNGKIVMVSQKILDELEILAQTHKGGFATINGYVSTSKRVTPEVANINFTSRYSNANLLKKRLDVLSSVQFSDLTLKGEKLTSLSKEAQKEQFDTCKAIMVESANKTLNGDRSDSYRQAHDNFYIQITEGVKVKLMTEKVGKETKLVTMNGLPIASHVMVMALEIGRTIIEKGEYKKVNSGPKVLMDQAINKVLKDRGVKTPKSLSLESGKYEYMKISNEILV
jgi:hypothetical protein